MPWRPAKQTVMVVLTRMLGAVELMYTYVYAHFNAAKPS